MSSQNKSGFRRPMNLESFVSGADAVPPSAAPAHAPPAIVDTTARSDAVAQPHEAAAPLVKQEAQSNVSNVSEVLPEPAPKRARSVHGHPWDKAREDVKKPINLQLRERHMLMLQYIQKHTPYSQQSFCREILEPAIEAKIRELTKDK